MSEPVPPDVRALLILHLTPGLGPLRTAALLERFGSASEVLRADVADIARRCPLISSRLAERIAHAPAEVDVDGELARVERAGVRLVPLGTPAYPASLAAIPDPPPLLYLRGTLTEADANAVALVGSRSCTGYGQRVAARLASGLVRAGVTIVSGLARGIDGVAHRAALEAGGRTLAVLAGGLARIYPPEHAGLADQVAGAGALLTESCMAQEPLAGLFPARNRLISGLCAAVVIIEAAQRSGALITARHAAEQGRTVLAVPGPVDAEASGGCHDLIRQGAVLCRGPEDVLEELHGPSALSTARTAESAAPPAAAAPPPGLDEVQRRVWDLLGEGPRHLDELVQHLSVGVPQLTNVLTLLEMKRVVRRLPGNRYQRC